MSTRKIHKFIQDNLLFEKAPAAPPPMVAPPVTDARPVGPDVGVEPKPPQVAGSPEDQGFDYGPGGVQQWIADWFTSEYFIPADPPGSGPPTYTYPSQGEVMSTFLSNWGQPGYNGQSLAALLAAGFLPQQS